MGLLMARGPRGNVGQHVAPRRAGLHPPAHRIDHLPQLMPQLRGVLAAEGQVGGDERPFLVGDIARIPPPVDRSALQLHLHTTRSCGTRARR
jgi:hypothetical protein